MSHFLLFYFTFLIMEELITLIDLSLFFSISLTLEFVSPNWKLMFLVRWFVLKFGGWVLTTALGHTDGLLRQDKNISCGDVLGQEDSRDRTRLRKCRLGSGLAGNMQTQTGPRAWRYGFNMSLDGWCVLNASSYRVMRAKCGLGAFWSCRNICFTTVLPDILFSGNTGRVWARRCALWAMGVGKNVGWPDVSG